MEKAVEGGIFPSEPEGFSAFLLLLTCFFVLFLQVAILRGREILLLLSESSREWLGMSFHEPVLSDQRSFIMALEKKFYNIEEMSELLGKSTASIYGHLARRQYDAVPMPMKLGRRLAWLVSGVDEWVDGKIREVEKEQIVYEARLNAEPRRRGRPRKGERDKK